MPAFEDKLEALQSTADERGLTPVSWWIGQAHHEEAMAALEGKPGVEIQAGQLVEIDGLPVKVLTESPHRLALWCREGALDL